MATLFPSSLSYWQQRGNNVNETGIQMPSSALNKSSLLLLIHGYNNGQDDATDSYNLFLGLQKELGNVNANLVGVYWPGSNWEGPAYYMQAIGQAKKTAPHLANDLYQQARARGYLKIDIVAHSLGARLTFETISELLKIKASDPALGGLVIGQVVLMAGAVPTHYLEDINKLSNALAACNGTLSVFSTHDYVLKIAFPVGQSAAGELFFPTALGHKKWSGGTTLTPPLQQAENHDAGHSDYWGGENKNFDLKRQAAAIVNKFLNVLHTDTRTMDTRNTPAARDTLTRDTAAERITAFRKI